MENKKTPDKWYFRTYVLVIAFLCVGPFALPLVWFNPGFSPARKIIITVIILIISYYLWVSFLYSLKSLKEYYHLLQELYKGV